MLIAGPAIVRRQVGRHLKRLRQEAGLTVEQVTTNRYIGISRAKMYKIEAGTLPVKPQDVATLCGQYRATQRESEALMTLALATQGEGWWQNYTEDIVPKWFDLYVTLEDAANGFSWYEPELVPGLLQTRAYAEQILRTPAMYVDLEEAERRIEVRIARQSILSRDDPPQLDVILNEAVLHRTVGGTEVMARQLSHLIDVGRRDRVSIRVIPFAAGAHSAMGSMFVLLEFPQEGGEPLEPPLAYVETLTGAMYLHGPGEVRVHRLAWADLNRRALDEAASASMIAAILDG